VQLDGSFHDWLEDRGLRGCLMDVVDDATNYTLARMGKEETIWAAAGILRAWIEKHDVPRLLYTDWKKRVQAQSHTRRAAAGRSPGHAVWTHVSEAGHRDPAASSPQAKGRVERMHGVHQDRLIKKLRRKKIASYEAANQYLEKEYLPEHNGRFARTAAKTANYHGRKPSNRELREIFRLETEHRISNDWVIRHDGRYFQLQPAGQRRYGPTQSKALVCEWEDGAMEVYYRGQRRAYQELPAPLPRKCGVEDRAKPSVALRLFAKARKLSQDHPWRQDYRKPTWSKKAEMPPPMVASMEASP
jgi:hypothetical protein